jgi:hypothetical protein
MPQAEHPAANWHQTPQARALIARLCPDDLIERKQLGIPADFTIMLPRNDQADRTLTALEELRAVAPVIELGYDYASTQQPFDEPAAHRFLDCMATAPDVRSVLLAAFRERAAAVAEAA